MISSGEAPKDIIALKKIIYALLRNSVQWKIKTSTASKIIFHFET